MMRADTVMGERLQLNPRQFRTLMVLATNEGELIPFDELHMSMSMPGEEKCQEHDARNVVESLVDIVNISGRGFAWVQRQAQDKYVFETKWGADWHNPATKLEEEGEVLKVKTRTAKTVHLPGFIFTAATLLIIALLAAGSFFFDSPSPEQLVYIPSPQIPLAGPASTISFPHVNGVEYVGGDNPGVLVYAYNPNESEILFLMCIKINGASLALPSQPVPAGQSVMFFGLFAYPGSYDVRITLRAYELNGFSEFGERYSDYVLHVD